MNTPKKTNMQPVLQKIRKELEDCKNKIKQLVKGTKFSSCNGKISIKKIKTTTFNDISGIYYLEQELSSITVRLASVISQFVVMTKGN